MPSDEKRNPLLDDLSDDDIHNSDSDDDLRKGATSSKSTNKRRRDSDASTDGGSVSESEEDTRVKGGRGKKMVAKEEESDDDDEEEDDNVLDLFADGVADTEVKGKEKVDAKAKLAKLATPKPLAKKNLIATEDAIKKSGVLYISRIPPFMKPHKLRTLLEPYGKINRTFLMTEDPTAHQRRVRNGGNKKKLFTEGWVEFVSKKDAKRAYEILNARTIGGKKGSYYRDDVWSLVYLKGFKWRDLMGQISAENAERGSRMQAEIAKATRENKEFVRNVERAKMLDGMQAKRRRRIGADGTAREGGVVLVGGAGVTVSGEKRAFEQTKRVVKDLDGKQPESVSRVLNKIF